MEVDAQGNIILSPLGKPLPGVFEGIEDHPPSRSEIRREKRRQRREVKREEKHQRKEDKIEAKQPTSMPIYAVPLVAGQSLTLVTTHNIPAGRIRSKAQHKLEQSFASLTPDKMYTVKGRVIRWTNRKMEGLPPSTRISSNTPKNISQIATVHPESVAPDQMLDNLVDAAITSKSRHKKKLAIYSIAFPFIVVDAALILFHARAFLGAKRLLVFAANSVDRISSSQAACLDKWMEILATQEEGVLDEVQIFLMCHELGTPELINTLYILRRKYLRENKRYDLLPPIQQ